jgi:RNA polymerase-binding transcription factor DksA
MRLDEKLRREHEERRREIDASLTQLHKDPADTAAEETERNVFFAELAMEENSLVEVEAALQRIRKGTYGICETTGRPISPVRLRALPWTRYCMEAAPGAKAVSRRGFHFANAAGEAAIPKRQAAGLAPSLAGPSEGEIREYAYKLYVQGGCIPGRDLEDWRAAESHLRAELSRTQPPPQGSPQAPG